jgi:hypothetical protein
MAQVPTTAEQDAKDPGAPSEHCRGEAEITVHLQRGKADIDAIG